jgi:hypothetical protein
VHRHLAAAAAAVPPGGAAALRLPAWVIGLIAGTELVALAIVELSQLRRQRRGHKAALRALRRMRGAASVRVDADGGFDVRRDGPGRSSGRLLQRRQPAPGGRGGRGPPSRRRP